jgi:hypothetical protein
MPAKKKIIKKARDYRGDVVKTLMKDDSLVPGRKEDILGALPRQMSESDARCVKAILSTDAVGGRKLSQIEALFGQKK